MRKDLKITVKREAIALIGDITYKNEAAWYGESERPLKMSLLVPKHKERHAKPLPLLLWLCGGGLRVVDHNIWLPQMISIAEAGFIVASVEYRTINDAALPKPLIDVKAAIRYLRAHAEKYCIDPERVFIMGESAGGMLASLAAVTPDNPEFEIGDYLDMSTRVSAAIDIYGITDLNASYEFAAQLNLIRGIEQLQKAGITDMADTKSLNRVSAIRYVKEDTVPFLILHGTEDEKVPISQSERFYKELKAKGVYCEFYRLEGCAHGVDEFYQPEIMELILNFMRKHLS